MLQTPVGTPQTDRYGAYGLTLRGLEAAAMLLVPAPAAWPPLTVLRAPAVEPPPREDTVGRDEARLPLAGGGWMHVQRDPARVRFHLATPRRDGDLVHPYLAPAAALVARWAGRESFHAGAVLVGDGAWGVLGDKEQGKSTLLAWLALHSHAILSDDLLVLERGAAAAGPRCLDLREASARQLGVGEPLGVVGARARWRVPLGSAPALAPLRGWITLAWGDEMALEPLRGPERLLALLPHRSVQLEPPSPAELIALSSLPVVRFTRPRRWDQLGAGAERLLAALREPGGLEQRP